MPTVDGAFIDLPERGLRLHYRDWGGPVAEEGALPVLLLHGLSSGSRIWDWTAPLLAVRYRTIALDQRGHGLSAGPEDGYGFSETTADLGAIIGALKLERPVVVGHSWGGGVALQFAVDYPDSVRGVVLVDGGFASSIGETPWEEAEKMMRPPDIDGTPVERFLGFARNWPDVRDVWNDDLAEMLLSNFEVRDGKIYRRLPIPTHMKIARAIWEQRTDAFWDRLTVPALLIPALREPASDREAHWNAAKLRGIDEALARAPDARVIRMENSIHDLPVQRPRELAQAILDFAGSVSAS